MSAQPRHQHLETEAVRRIEILDERVGFFSGREEPKPVDGEKRIGRRKGRALVAVNERVILSQAFPKRGGFLDEIDIVAGFRPKQRRLQMPGTPDSRSAAVAGYLIRVHREHFGQGEVVGHFASFR